MIRLVDVATHKQLFLGNVIVNQLRFHLSGNATTQASGLRQSRFRTVAVVLRRAHACPSAPNTNASSTNQLATSLPARQSSRLAACDIDHTDATVNYDNYPDKAEVLLSIGVGTSVRFPHHSANSPDFKKKETSL